MRYLAPTAAFLALIASCGPKDGLDTKLSTELANARFVVTLWPPEEGSLTPSATQPAHTKCGMQLKDETTGTIYQLATSTKKMPPDGPPDPANWPEYGDYSIHKAEENSSGATHRVRIQCGSWKPLAVMTAR